MRCVPLCFSLFLIPTGIAMAQPVPEPNGKVLGHFGSVEFDLPALCERAPFVTVRTHGPEGHPAFEAAIIPSSITSVEIRADGETHQFGTTVEGTTFPVMMEGSLDDTEYSFELTCPAEFSS